MEGSVRALTIACLVAAATGTATTSFAEDSSDELPRQLFNPVSSLISAPFQHNFDFGAGADGNAGQDTQRQPVIRLALNWGIGSTLSFLYPST